MAGFDRHAITSGSWAVAVGGVPVLSGTVDNADGKTSAERRRRTRPSTLAPVQWVLSTNALIPVAGEMTGPEGSCTGSGWITGTGGSPTSSPVFYMGVGFIGLGLAMAITMVVATKAAAGGSGRGRCVMKVRRHPILGFFAGIFLGIGVALTLFVFGVIPMTAVWLGALAVGFAVLGIVGAYAVPARGRGAVRRRLSAGR